MKQKPIGKEQVEVPIQGIVNCIKKEFTEMQPELHQLFDSDLKSIADQLLAVDLLTVENARNPSYHVINKAFFAGFFLDTVDQINEHCRKFLSAMYNLGGSFRKAADIVKKRLNDSLVKNFNFSLHF